MDGLPGFKYTSDSARRAGVCETPGRVFVIFALSAVSLTLVLSASTAADLRDNPAPLPFTPPEAPPAEILLWQAVETNLPRSRSPLCYEPFHYQMFGERDPGKPAPFAVYELAPPHTGRYAVYAAVHVQGVPYTSPLRYRWNDGPWHPVPPAPSGTPRWGISSAMAWTPLGERPLEKGETARLHLQAAETRPLDGKTTFYLNGIAAFRVDRPGTVQVTELSVTPSPPEPGTPLTVSVRTADRPPPAKWRDT